MMAGFEGQTFEIDGIEIQEVERVEVEDDASDAPTLSYEDVKKTVQATMRAKNLSTFALATIIGGRVGNVEGGAGQDGSVSRWLGAGLGKATKSTEPSESSVTAAMIDWLKDGAPTSVARPLPRAIKSAPAAAKLSAAKSRAASQRSSPKKPIEKEQTPPSYASVKRRVMETMQEKGIAKGTLSKIIGPRLGCRYAAVQAWLGTGGSTQSDSTRMRYMAVMHEWLSEGAPTEVPELTPVDVGARAPLEPVTTPEPVTTKSGRAHKAPTPFEPTTVPYGWTKGGLKAAHAVWLKKQYEKQKQRKAMGNSSKPPAPPEVVRLQQLWGAINEVSDAGAASSKKRPIRNEAQEPPARKVGKTTSPKPPKPAQAKKVASKPAQAKQTISKPAQANKEISKPAQAKKATSKPAHEPKKKLEHKKKPEPKKEPDNLAHASGASALPANDLKGSPGLIQKVAFITETLELDGSLSLRDAVKRANEMVGLGSGDHKDVLAQLAPLLLQVDALLDALGVDSSTLLATAV